MKIPDDVRIVSYDGTVITRLTSPLMTSIVQPVSELASESVRLIDEMINGKNIKIKDSLGCVNSKWKYNKRLLKINKNKIETVK